MKKVIILLIFLKVISYSAIAGSVGIEGNPKQKEDKKTYALVICGINKDPEERLAKNKAVTDLRSFFLNKAGIKPAYLNVLVPEGSFIDKNVKISNSENLKRTLENLANEIGPEDRFIFYYIGQANVGAGKLRFNLPGKDITHDQLSDWIKPIKAASMLLVLDCPGAGRAVKALTGKGRIIIGASMADQPYSTKFSEYFIPSLLDDRGDTDSDGRVSLLEAFTFASRQLDDWYFDQLFLKTETPVLEDNADGLPSQEPWRYKQDNTDGREASKFFFIKL